MAAWHSSQAWQAANPWMLQRISPFRSCGAILWFRSDFQKSSKNPSLAVLAAHWWGPLCRALPAAVVHALRLLSAARPGPTGSACCCYSPEAHPEKADLLSRPWVSSRPTDRRDHSACISQTPRDAMPLSFLRKTCKPGSITRACSYSPLLVASS